MAESIHLTITGREGRVFEGDVISLSSVNKKGTFDILPSHANFISLLERTLVARLSDGTTREISVDNGVMKVRENKVSVYLGIKK